MGLTILYIEDNPDNKVLVDRVVESMGHKLLWAPNGAQGLEMVETHQPAILLLDINLPDIDGYEIARRLRADPKHATLPIIALTANALRGDAEKVLAAGCSAYIPKPIIIGELRKQIVAAINTSPVSPT
jgi:CheY-like chemotaxis protein